MKQVKMFSVDAKDTEVNQFMSKVINPKILSVSPFIVEYDDGKINFEKASTVYKGLPQIIMFDQDSSYYDYGAECMEFKGMFDSISIFSDRFVFMRGESLTCILEIAKTNRSRYCIYYGDDHLDRISLGTGSLNTRTDGRFGRHPIELHFLTDKIDNFVEEFNFKKGEISVSFDKKLKKYLITD